MGRRIDRRAGYAASAKLQGVRMGRMGPEGKRRGLKRALAS